MGKAKKNAVAKRRLKKIQKNKAATKIRIKNGGSSRPTPSWGRMLPSSSGLPEEVEIIEPSGPSIDDRIEEASSMKDLYKLASEIGVPKARDYKAADRADLEAAIREMAKG